MRSFALSLVSVIALASSASAADIYSSGGLKDTPVLIPVNTWAGFYFGLNGGYGWNADNKRLSLFDVTAPAVPSDPFNGGDPSGGFGGGQIGYNWQWDRFVFGLEGDLQGSGISGSTTTISTTTVPTEFARVDSDLTWFGTIRGRLGYTFNNVLFYGTGGFAAGGVKDSAFFGPNSVTPDVILNRNRTETGFAAGGGIEYAWNPSWSVKAEYQFISLSSDHPGNALDRTDAIVRTSNFNHDFNTVRVGVNYHINNQYVPLK